jgi:hypothetical protein
VSTLFLRIVQTKLMHSFAIALILSAMACGYAGSPNGSGDTVSGARTASPSPTITSQWPRYNDPDYQFGVSYPPKFTFARQHGSPSASLLMTYRTLDPAYTNAYPPGQIEIAVYAKDTNTLSEWVAKHSGAPSSSNATRYWGSATNQATTTVAGRNGLTFDWVPDQMDKTVHATAVFLGTTYVLVLQWWSTDPTYASTLQQYYQQMVGQIQM